MIDIYFSQNLRLLRKRRGDNQSDISEVIGVDVTSYGGYERGKSFPKFEMLTKIVDYFQINLHDLVYTNLSVHPQGLYAKREKMDPRTERVIARLNREIDKLAEDVIRRATPEDLVGLMQLRAELIDKYPETAREYGIKK